LKQQSGIELQKRSFTKKEGSPKRFAITGACNTTVPVPLLKRPIPPAKQPLNLPIASPRNLQEDEERSSKITSLPQQFKSRPTTRTSMQTSEGISKSSFQQYILATADYMRTSSEPFSMISGSPLDSRAQSQTPRKQIPLRVQSLPDFSVYTSRELLESGMVSSHYSRQQDYDRLNSTGSQSAIELVNKRQNRALKLEVDLRDATRLASTDVHSEVTSTQQVGEEQTTTPTERTSTPTEQAELPTVNVIESQTPYPNTTTIHDHNVNDIYWDQQSDNLAVSKAVTESSSTVTLRDLVLSHSVHHHDPLCSDSLYGGQSTAERSYDQVSCSEQDLGDVQEDDYLGSASLSNMGTGGLDASVRAQTDMDATSAFDKNISTVMLPDHLDNTASVGYHVNASTMTDKFPSSRLTTNVDSGTTPSSHRSHVGLILYQDPSFTPTLKETSVSTPAMVTLGVQHRNDQETVKEVTNASQAEVTLMMLKPTTVEEPSCHDDEDDDVLTPSMQHEPNPIADSVFEHDSGNVPDPQVAAVGLFIGENASSASSLHHSKDSSCLVNDHAKVDDDMEQDDSQEPSSFQQPSDYSTTDTYSQVDTLSGLHLHVDTDLNLAGDTDLNLADDTMTIEQKYTTTEQDVVTKTWSDQIMDKLLNNQADDIPVHSLAVSCKHLVVCKTLNKTVK